MVSGWRWCCLGWVTPASCLHPAAVSALGPLGSTPGNAAEDVIRKGQVSLLAKEGGGEVFRLAFPPWAWQRPWASQQEPAS